MSDSDYTAIRVTSLRGDLQIPFDVYIKVAGKYILYCRQGSSFEGGRLDRLKSKRLKAMYIRKDDEIPYRQYLEQSIDQAFGSKSKPIQFRAEVVQGFLQSGVEQFLNDPSDKFAYDHIRSSAQRFVDFLVKEPEGLPAMLAIQNTDASITQHGVNVATLATSMALAQTESRDLPSIEIIGVGALLHDLEHFHTNFNVARPIKSLSPDELATYKSHCLNGAHRLQGSAFVDQLVINVITQHEEHMDASGFPKRLEAKDIDPLVMIVATANAYDRLVSFEGQSPKSALKTLLIEKMGAHPLTNLQTLQDILKNKNVV